MASTETWLTICPISCRLSAARMISGAARSRLDQPFTTDKLPWSVAAQAPHGRHHPRRSDSLWGGVHSCRMRLAPSINRRDAFIASLPSPPTPSTASSSPRTRPSRYRASPPDSRCACSLACWERVGPRTSAETRGRCGSHKYGRCTTRRRRCRSPRCLCKSRSPVGRMVRGIDQLGLNATAGASGFFELGGRCTRQR
jgi:hypothetical protein